MAKKRLSCILMAILMLFPLTARAVSYSDISGHWAETAIEKWSVQYHILNGYDDGTFRPNEPITRGAFAAIVDRILQYQSISPTSVFSDIVGEWCQDEVLKLNAAGVFLGDGGKANIYQNITRQQAAVMLGRAFQLEESDQALTYADSNDVSNYAKGYISAMTQKGYINDVGDDYCYRPTEAITRAEVVNILYNMVDILIQNEGTYTSHTSGDLLINASGAVTLKDASIGGDLVIAPGVQADVTLLDCTLSGQIRNQSDVQVQILESEEPSDENPDTTTDPDNENPDTTVEPNSENPDTTVEPNSENPDTTVEPNSENPDTTVEPNSENPDTTTDPDNENPDTTVEPNSENPDTTTDPDSENPDTTTEPDNENPDTTTEPNYSGETFTYGGKTYQVWNNVQKSTLDKSAFQWESDGSITYHGAECTTQKGIDISAYQNRATDGQTIDWDAVKDDGIDFVFVRVGGRYYGSGETYYDSFYPRNIDGAMAAGLDTGVYFFSQAITVEEALEEADMVLEALKDHPISSYVAYDWELPSGSRAFGTPMATATACAVAFCQRIQQAGYKPLIYVGTNVGYNYFDLSQLTDYPLWYAGYPATGTATNYPIFYYEIEYWQYSSSGTVNGIGGSVDMDIRFVR